METWCATTSCSSRAMLARSRATASRSLSRLSRSAASTFQIADCRLARSISPAPQAAMTARASAAVASHGVAFPRMPAAPSSTATSVRATARMAGRRASMTGHAASATSQPVTAATDQDSRPNTMNAALAVSTTEIAGSGNLLITAIGAVLSRPSTSARLGLIGPAARPDSSTAASASTAAITIGPAGLR